ncbi:hypothetical protein Zmor_020314 [Zophobas morio]|uniref:Uncharacterized protein n=1 Tax=Zophobas morio TaxID=2755281 RepID=A0AA38M9J9_9CUCU|nr:hypothetical protein Zmor_020314 [Zophobas morio]
MSVGQFNQLLEKISNPGQRPVSRHFTQCIARFGVIRISASVEEFINTITIFKTVDALAGLPLLLTGEANQWWCGVRQNITTFPETTQLIRKAFAPRKPNFCLFGDIFSNRQGEEVPTYKFVIIQRDRLAQLSHPLDEEWQLRALRDRLPRTDINSFAELLEKACSIKANEEERHANRFTRKPPVAIFVHSLRLL